LRYPSLRSGFYRKSKFFQNLLFSFGLLALHFEFSLRP